MEDFVFGLQLLLICHLKITGILSASLSCSFSLLYVPTAGVGGEGYRVPYGTPINKIINGNFHAEL